MITFKEETHEYFNSDKKLISVTQLMRKHGLAPSYDGVPSAVLRAKAERGSLIHAEIEDYIKHGEIGFTSELQEFIKWCNDNEVKFVDCEKIVYNDVAAGKLDLKVRIGDKIYLADNKTTASYHAEPLSWQLSIYDFLDNEGVDGYLCLWFSPKGLQVKEVAKKPKIEVARLMESERRGEIYKQTLTVQDTQLARLVEVETLISQIEEQKKAAEAQATELREAILQAMKDNGLQTFETDRIKLTYVAPTTRTAIDSTRLKKEMPEIAEKYTKTSKVKASLRVNLKEA